MIVKEAGIPACLVCVRRIRLSHSFLNHRSCQRYISFGKLQRFYLCMSLFSATGTGFFVRTRRKVFRAWSFAVWQPASENGGIYVTDKEFDYYS